MVDGVLAGQLCSLDNSEQEESAASALVDLGTQCARWRLVAAAFLSRDLRAVLFSRYEFLLVLHCLDR
jgi:hypothetical protein